MEGDISHLGYRTNKGECRQAFGRSRGGLSTKIHIKTDPLGGPLAFHPTGGKPSAGGIIESGI